jgi:uncharacterized protein (TIGR02145 family)
MLLIFQLALFALIVVSFLLVIVPEMVIVAGVNMNIESNISTSIHQQMNYSVGVLYENETWTPTQENTKSFTYQPPTLSADANAKAYIKPQLNFKVYGTVSPSIYGEAYGRIEADLLENPWWAIYGGANVGLGVKMKIWNQELFDWPETPFYIFDYEQLIAQSTNPPVDLPIVTTAEITSIGQSIATGGGNVTDQGGSIVSVRGVCWSTSQNPSLTDSHVTSGNGTGVFICNITGLSANTTYYVRAYAMNTDGVGYGNQVQFTTIGEGQIPTIITNSITNIGQTTATGGGNVTTQGSTTVTARGVCWSASQNPTITNSHTNNGSGEGTFTSNITGLSVSTTYYVRAYATNSAGTAYGDQESFTTSGNGTLPTITTNSITNITETSATGGGNVTSGGNTSVTERGVCWSTSQNPTVTNSHTSNGSGEGTFTSNITGLSVSTTYYVRAYATNSAGTAYGDQESFTTTGSGSAPTVTTASITNITETSATGGGNVTSDGGTTIAARGVCWSTSQNPTITDEITINGGGTGSFTSNLTGLAANTAYYVRAYATNIAGTAYGDQESFTTTGSGTFPIVATISISSISRSTAIGGGEVINEGSEEVTERGVCWSTHIQPSISDQRSIDGNGIGIYLSHITGLSSSTMYYVRAYAINNFGTSYGEQLSFTTSDQGQETVTDIDGNIYSTLIIGSRQWMGEDLKVTHYNNGDDIPNITDGNQWYNQNSGAYCWYNNNENLYFNTYGALYNWFVTIDERKVCPIGWVVPDITDWQEIFIALEQENVGGKLKETGTTHWLSPNTDATNETNFTILPAGYRLPNGEFNSMGYGNSYWYTDEARQISASNSSGNFVIIAGNSQPKMGVSLRCIKTR